MQKIPVVLNYSHSMPGNFGPNPRTVTVYPGDTIVFTRGPEAPDGSTLRITLSSTSTQLVYFSEPQVQHQPGQKGSEPLHLTVTGPLTERVTYRCELLGPGGISLASVDGDTGGEIMPLGN